MPRTMNYLKNIYRIGLVGIISLFYSAQSYAQSCTINLLIAYTDDAVDSVGSDKTLVNAILDAAEYMNTINIYSEVQQHISLVRTVQLNGFETSCFTNDLNRFQQSNYIDSLRTKYHADVAVIVLGNDEFCGQPYLDNTVAEDSTAYCAVNYYCMLNGFAISHQVAHLFGCGHSSDSRTQADETPYSYGHGFVWEYEYDDDASLTTIMGVADDFFCGDDQIYGSDDDDDDCDIIPYFSNPTLYYNGIQLGKPEINDNARVLNQNSVTIGGFKLVPTNQLSLNDTIDHYNIANASAKDTLATGTTYKVMDSANVKFESSQRIVLNPGFSAAEGVRFETILRDPENQCGQ